jgi:aminopeptidase N
MERGDDGKVSLSQERFTVNFQNPPALEWKVPLTYFVAGNGEPKSRLMTGKTDQLEGIPADRALKLNADGAGNYRVQYDKTSWDLLIGSLGRLDVQDRVNLLGDTWALVQANRAPFLFYLGLVEKLSPSTQLAEREQIITAFDFINRLLIGSPEQEKFQRYARSVLRPSFDTLGWDPKPGEPAKAANLRASLIAALGHLNDQEIVAGCRDHFQKYLKDPALLAPDLRPAVFGLVGRHADEATWNSLHELGLKTTSIEEKQNYYNALAAATDPKLIKKTLPIALTDELPTSRAVFLVSRVARESEHPEMAWEFAKAHMKALLAKADALALNSYAPGLFTFFLDRARIAQLHDYAKNNLPAASAKEVAKAVDEMEFRIEFRDRLRKQIAGAVWK